MAVYVTQAFRQLLVGDSTVGGLVGTRVYQDVAPPNVSFPYMVFVVIDDEPYRNLSAASGLTVARVELSVYASPDSPSDLDDSVEAARLALDNFNGTVTVGSESLNLTQVQHIDTSILQVPVESGQSMPIRARAMEFRVTYPQTIATH